MKIKLLLLVLFLTFINVDAQIGFQERSVIDDKNNLDGVVKIINADLDGDGDMDVLSASFRSYKIEWYENLDGKGDFGLQQIISTNVQGANFICAADIDGDGDLDVVSSSAFDDKIAWYENLDGKGNFGIQQIITIETDYPEIVHVTDIDGDNDLDILSFSAKDKKLAWYENLDGKGRFGVQNIITNNYSAISSINAEDIDIDGDIDIIVSINSSGIIIWYENIDNQDGFTSLGNAIADGGEEIRDAYLTDIDNDGDIDVFSSSSKTSSAIGWYENDGLGNFSSKRIIEAVSGSSSVFGSDLDNDGDQDLVVTSLSFENRKIVWYENLDSKGNFGSQNVVVSLPDNRSRIGTTDISISISDLNNDSNLDLVFSFYEMVDYRFFTDKIAWLENLNGQGDFGAEQIIDTNAYYPLSNYAIDIDGDGDIDVLSASRDDDKIAWYENKNGLGNFSKQKIITENAYLANSVFAIDIDGDGDADVISSSEDKISWYENIDGNGVFSTEKNINTNAYLVNSVFAIDIDGDGDADVLSTSGDKIAWYENIDGNGVFSTEKIITENVDATTSVFAIDIDGDGDADVLSSSYSDNKIAWYENTNGLGEFGVQQIISTDINGAYSVSAIDMDGDGKIDVLSSSWVDNEIVWFKNLNGLGDFGAQQIISTSLNGVTSVHSVDVDNDGDIDVLSSSKYDDKIAWYENTDGQGVFGGQQIISTDADGASSVYAADIDGDGDIDVLSTSADDDKIAWYENLGLITNKINGLIKLDVNGDGCDVNDFVFPNLMVVTNNGAESLATFSLKNGFYQLFTSEGDFTTEITSTLPDYYEATPNSHTSDFSSIGNTDTSDFCLVPNQTINDLSITLLPTSQARPGFDAKYQLVINNVGTTQLSEAIVLEFDNSKLSFLTASETVSTQTTNSISFEYSNLNPFETRTLDLGFNVIAPPTTNIGDILKFTATINPISGDNTENDNVFELNQTLIGSYDPNDIAVLEGSQVLLEDADEYLHYIIRFQNTGTADAINVRVDNVLDPNLDWNTIQLESSSHANRVEIKDGNEVSFIFNGIYLPDSTTDEPNSHGFIAYKIKPKDGIEIGEVMQNKADIFFDFNLPIITNTVSTEIASALSVNRNEFYMFQIFPNPTQDILNIKSNSEITKLEIYNNLGQIIKSEFNKTSIDVSKLNTGLYFIKIEDVIGNSETKKIVKK